MDSKLTALGLSGAEPWPDFQEREPLSPAAKALVTACMRALGAALAQHIDTGLLAAGDRGHDGNRVG